MSRLRMLVVLALPTLLPAQDKALQEAFNGYDADKNGHVTRTEFPGSDEQFALMDPDRNGRVTFKEFAASPIGKRLLVARNKEENEPRARLSDADLAAPRLAALLARDGTGKVARDDWHGAPLAFEALDLDHNNVLDARDLRLARGEAPLPPPTPLDFTSVLPPAEELMAKLDRDNDQQLTPAELKDHKIAPLFERVDRNKNQRLDLDELRAAVDIVGNLVRKRNDGKAKPRAYQVPFSGWDKNKDGRLELDEFKEYKELFGLMDVDRDGAVTPAEVERYRRSVEGEDFVSRFDLNGDGRVTLEEFGGSPDAFRRADRNGDGVIDQNDG